MRAISAIAELLVVCDITICTTYIPVHACRVISNRIISYSSLRAIFCLAVKPFNLFFLIVHVGKLFTVRLHVMQRTVLLSEFCPSVCLSVRQMRVL